MTASSLHLNFPGCCEEAFHFYVTHLGATMGHALRYGDSPMSDQVPEHWQEKIINADCQLNGMRITGGDLPPDQFVAPAGFALLLAIESEEETRQLFSRLAAGGQIQLELQATFWSSCYGIVTDPFGITWKLNCTSRA
jgi:PhnB protein